MFEQSNSTFYYYEAEGSFHARIFLPKNEQSDFRWHYYEQLPGDLFYYRTENIPNWFRDIVQKASEMVYYRDRLRRISKGKDNEFYKPF